MGLFDRASVQARFWQWFGKNSARLLEFEGDEQRLLGELRRELARVKKGLVYEFGATEKRPRVFVVSADGNRKLFSAVRDLVDAAPELPDWHIIPFRPPGSLNVVIEYGGHSLSPDDIWFSTELDGERVGLTLFVQGLTEETKPVLGNACFILLDNALGEYSVETEVGFVEFKPLPGEGERSGLRPFSEIREPFHGTAH